ncbi:DUF177 domain-containing protein [Kaistia dalseonensis]|uniref:Uncharacterized metal-binding protein YceD (DUF177 family) n=1 Tax=Kaistia dalseonensis TaxID=410840 RepID=A0ABU0H1K8_9HYPH|nr:DUF177 domain-containing protein [Kaistia dalseonensis]MCX5493631.1 DUF177 domain-containing protein [Kaistia dalseonensis]MDQ0436192.1 uncharacterized metal-binding protein YceD (DUF177 family) [Kaistia dalseonensis]
MSSIPFSRIVDIARLGRGRTNEHLVADAEERRAIAKEFGILELTALEADLAIETWRRVGLKIEGRLRADAVQACVVTVEPVPEHIDQPFTLTFLPPEAMAKDPKTVAEAEVIVVFDEDDPPDELVGHTIDLGAIVTEQLALALDPYPRAPGAELPKGLGTHDEEEGSPFAALSSLRQK